MNRFDKPAPPARKGHANADPAAPGRPAGEVSGLVLGIECGGTRTVALLADMDGNLVQRAETGAANARLLTDAQLLSHFKQLAEKFPRPTSLGIGMAGVRGTGDRQRIIAAASAVWPGVPCWAGNDLETALEAAGEPTAQQATTRIIIISGTGSCCYGRSPKGKIAKVGGWGHLLGDQGSGYDIALDAMKSLVQNFDASGRWPHLGQALLRALMLNVPNDLITWIHGASKAEVAALAKHVFAAATSGDRLARDVLARAVTRLADAGAACARRLAKPGDVVEFVFVGGVLHNQRPFARRLAAELLRRWPRATARWLEREGSWGAVAIARRIAPPTSCSRQDASVVKIPAIPAQAIPIPRSTKISPTEQRNPRSMRLDKAGAEAAVRVMLSEDAAIPRALMKHRRLLASAVRMVARSLQRGGRLFYVGAGTSGRLGALDASECPPTFGAPPDQVQAIIAGGQPALWSSIEGAEDDAIAGADAIRFRGVTRKDVVLGIAASGRTPFVWGALHEARRVGASTLLVCFNPHLAFGSGMRPDLVIAPDIGPEVLTGSTRLKSGTATKLILNIITTLAMVRLGKVMSNLMVDVRPANAKLRDRAVRIVCELTGADAARAQTALERSSWVVRRAIQLCARKPASWPANSTIC